MRAESLYDLERHARGVAEEPITLGRTAQALRLDLDPLRSHALAVGEDAGELDDVLACLEFAG